ncbi:MAG: DUF6323 family protein [Lachnospiraceae bacterium]
MKVGMAEEAWMASPAYQQEKLLWETNRYTGQFGLILTKEDIDVLIRERMNCLKEQQRIEFGEGILPKLIFAFCDSSFIFQENYLDTLIRLQEIFYLYKNEALDELSDDELIAYMQESYNGECQGSLEYLEAACLEAFARGIRSRTHRFIGRREDERI